MKCQWVSKVSKVSSVSEISGSVASVRSVGQLGSNVSKLLMIAGCILLLISYY